MPIETGICPTCKKEVDIKASNLDSEDCFSEVDCYVLVEHNSDDGKQCAGSNKHTEQLLDKDYGDDDDDGLTLADVLEEEHEAREHPRQDWLDH